MYQLWKLEKIDLRDIWKHEALDFTNWLAEEENLSLLSDEIGIAIELQETEASVWGFNVDILALEEVTGKKIIIENQLETTDHKHLGQILTYASWLDAEYIIWLVKDVRDEHKQAIDWLNEHTDNGLNFFIVKMELWKIGESNIAPRFNVYSKPNDWSKLIKSLSWGNKELSNTKLIQLEFWNSLIDYFNENKTPFSIRKARPQHWYDLGIWTSWVHMSLTVNSQYKHITTDIYIVDSKELFDFLYDRKDSIESELWYTLEWNKLEDKKASRIKYIKQDVDFTEKENWNTLQEWYQEVAPKMYKVFSKHIKKFH